MAHSGTAHVVTCYSKKDALSLLKLCKQKKSDLNLMLLF